MTDRISFQSAGKIPLRIAERRLVDAERAYLRDDSRENALALLEARRTFYEAQR